MKIKFKKKRLYFYLMLGLFWTAIGIYNLIEVENIRWINYGYLVAGILYVGNYLYCVINQYLTIENGTIKKNSLFGKEINLNDITWINKFAGDYTLKTEKQELKIHTKLIEEKSLTELNIILEKLNLQ
jgi:hypothetical protein